MSAPPRLEPSTPSWCQRHLTVALGLGLGLGIAGQIAVYALAQRVHQDSFALHAAAIVYTAGGWVALGVLLGALTQPLLRNRAGRLLALVTSVTVLAALALTQVAGIALRVLSGAYLTSGAVAFSLNSSDHFLHAAAGTYWRWAAGIVLVLVLFGVAIGRALRPATGCAAAWPPLRLVGLAVGLMAFLTFVYINRGQSPFTRRMFASGPLVALVGSLDDSGDEFELPMTLSGVDALGAPLAPEGPPLSEGPAWERRSREHDGPRPNVLLLMLESVGVEHLSHRGYPRPTTPALDRLARDGLDMRRAWSTATHSNYSQMAVLSSLFPRRGYGLDVYERLDYPRVLFHDVFHVLGYETATISSQDEHWQGMRRFQDTGTPTFYWHSEDYRGGHLDTGTERIVPDGRTIDIVFDWLTRERDAPWALYVNLQATHFPYHIPRDAERPWTPDQPTWATFNYLRYPRAEREVVVNRYDNALAYVDLQIGRIYDFLESVGELDNTLWIITSDHGEAFFHKDLVTHGKTLYDFEARVPLVLHWPMAIEPAIRDEPVSNLDVMPTVLDYLGLEPHPSFQGTSFREPGGEGDPAVYMNIQGLRFADGIVCWPYKLIVERTDKEQYLFDLLHDPAEEHNLLERRPEVARRLGDTLKRQLLAQLAYHRPAAGERLERYQPRLRPCPELP